MLTYADVCRRMLTYADVCYDKNRKDLDQCKADLEQCRKLNKVKASH